MDGHPAESSSSGDPGAHSHRVYFPINAGGAWPSPMNTSQQRPEATPPPPHPQVDFYSTYSASNYPVPPGYHPFYFGHHGRTSEAPNPRVTDSVVHPSSNSSNSRLLQLGPNRETGMTAGLSVQRSQDHVSSPLHSTYDANHRLQADAYRLPSRPPSAVSVQSSTSSLPRGTTPELEHLGRREYATQHSRKSDGKLLSAPKPEPSSNVTKHLEKSSMTIIKRVENKFANNFHLPHNSDKILPSPSLDFKPVNEPKKEEYALDLSVKTLRKTPDSTAPDAADNNSDAPNILNLAVRSDTSYGSSSSVTSSSDLVNKSCENSENINFHSLQNKLKRSRNDVDISQKSNKSVKLEVDHSYESMIGVAGDPVPAKLINDVYRNQNTHRTPYSIEELSITSKRRSDVKSLSSNNDRPVGAVPSRVPSSSYASEHMSPEITASLMADERIITKMPHPQSTMESFNPYPSHSENSEQRLFSPHIENNGNFSNAMYPHPWNSNQFGHDSAKSYPEYKYYDRRKMITSEMNRDQNINDIFLKPLDPKFSRSNARSPRMKSLSPHSSANRSASSSPQELLPISDMLSRNRSSSTPNSKAPSPYPSDSMTPNSECSSNRTLSPQLIQAAKLNSSATRTPDLTSSEEPTVPELKRDITNNSNLSKTYDPFHKKRNAMNYLKSENLTIEESNNRKSKYFHNDQVSLHQSKNDNSPNASVMESDSKFEKCGSLSVTPDIRKYEMPGSSNSDRVDKYLEQVDGKKSESYPKKHLEKLHDRHSEEINSIQSEKHSNKIDRHSERPDSRHSDRPDSRHSDRPDSRHSDRPDSRHCERPDSRHSERPDSRHSERPDSRHSERPDSRHSERPDSRHSERPDSRHSERPDSRHSERPESIQSGMLESIQSERPESIQSERPESIQSGRPESRQSGRPESRQSGRPDSKQDSNQQEKSERGQSEITEHLGIPKVVSSNLSDERYSKLSHSGYSEAHQNTSIHRNSETDTIRHSASTSNLCKNNDSEVVTIAEDSETPSTLMNKSPSCKDGRESENIQIGERNESKKLDECSNTNSIDAPGRDSKINASSNEKGNLPSELTRLNQSETATAKCDSGEKTVSNRHLLPRCNQESNKPQMQVEKNDAREIHPHNNLTELHQNSHYQSYNHLQTSDHTQSSTNQSRQSSLHTISKHSYYPPQSPDQHQLLHNHPGQSPILPNQSPQSRNSQQIPSNHSYKMPTYHPQQSSAHHPQASARQPHQSPALHPQTSPALHPQTSPAYHPQQTHAHHPQQTPAHHPQQTPAHHPQQTPAHHPQQTPAHHPQKTPAHHPQQTPAHHPQQTPAHHPQQTPAHHPQQTPAHHPQQTPAHHPQQTPAHHPQQTPAHHPQQTPAHHPQQTPAHHPQQTPAHHPQQTPAHHPQQTPAHHPQQTPAHHPPAHHPQLTPAHHPQQTPAHHPQQTPAHHPQQTPAHHPQQTPAHHPQQTQAHHLQKSPAHHLQASAHQPHKSPALHPLTSPALHSQPSPARHPQQSTAHHPSHQHQQSPAHQHQQSPARHPQQSPARHPQQSPARHPQQSPARHPQQSPVSHLQQQSPARHPQQSPARHPQQSPARHPQQSPARHPQQSPARHPQQSPARLPQQFPARHPQQSPTRHPQQSPTRHPQQSPTCHPQQSPAHHHQQSPAHHHQQSPAHHHQQSPAHHHQQSPAHHHQQSPAHHHQQSPAHHHQQSPAHHHQQSPAHHHQQSPAHHHQQSPAHHHQQSPAHHHQQSPAHHHQQSPAHHHQQSPAHHHQQSPAHHHQQSSAHHPQQSSAHHPQQSPVLPSSRQSPTVHPSKSPALHASKSPALHASKSPALHASKSPALHASKSPALHASKSPALHASKSPALHASKSPSEIIHVSSQVYSRSTEHNFPPHLANVQLPRGLGSNNKPQNDENIGSLSAPLNPSINHKSPRTIHPVSHADPTNNYLDSNSQSKNPYSQYPHFPSQYPDPRSQYPDPRSRYSDPRSQYPDPRSHYPDLRSQYPDPRSQYPDPRSQYPDPRSQYPNPSSQHPGHRSLNPDSQYQHSQYPDMRSNFCDPKSRLVDPRSKNPDSRSKYPEVRSPYPDPHSQYPGARLQNHEMRPHYSDPRPQLSDTKTKHSDLSAPYPYQNSISKYVSPPKTQSGSYTTTDVKNVTKSDPNSSSRIPISAAQLPQSSLAHSTRHQDAQPVPYSTPRSNQHAGFDSTQRYTVPQSTVHLTDAPSKYEHPTKNSSSNNFQEYPHYPSQYHTNNPFENHPTNPYQFPNPSSSSSLIKNEISENGDNSNSSNSANEVKPSHYDPSQVEHSGSKNASHSSHTLSDPMSAVNPFSIDITNDHHSRQVHTGKQSSKHFSNKYLSSESGGGNQFLNPEANTLINKQFLSRPTSDDYPSTRGEKSGEIQLSHFASRRNSTLVPQSSHFSVNNLSIKEEPGTKNEENERNWISPSLYGKVENDNFEKNNGSGHKNSNFKHKYPHFDPLLHKQNPIPAEREQYYFQNHFNEFTRQSYDSNSYPSKYDYDQLRMKASNDLKTSHPNRFNRSDNENLESKSDIDRKLIKHEEVQPSVCDSSSKKSQHSTPSKSSSNYESFERTISSVIESSINYSKSSEQSDSFRIKTKAEQKAFDPKKQNNLSEKTQLAEFAADSAANVSKISSTSTTIKPEVAESWDQSIDKLVSELANNREVTVSKKTKTLGKRYQQKIVVQEAIDNDQIAPIPPPLSDLESESDSEAPAKFRGKVKSIKNKSSERFILTYASHSEESCTELIPDEDASDFEIELQKEISSRKKPKLRDTKKRTTDSKEHKKISKVKSKTFSQLQKKISKEDDEDFSPSSDDSSESSDSDKSDSSKDNSDAEKSPSTDESYRKNVSSGKRKLEDSDSSETNYSSRCKRGKRGKLASKVLSDSSEDDDENCKSQKTPNRRKKRRSSSEEKQSYSRIDSKNYRNRKEIRNLKHTLSTRDSKSSSDENKNVSACENNASKISDSSDGDDIKESERSKRKLNKLLPLVHSDSFDEDEKVIKKQKIVEKAGDDKNETDNLLHKLKNERLAEMIRDDVVTAKRMREKMSAKIKEKLDAVHEAKFRQSWSKPKFGSENDFRKGWEYEFFKYKKDFARLPEKLLRCKSVGSLSFQNMLKEAALHRTLNRGRSSSRINRSRQFSQSVDPGRQGANMDDIHDRNVSAIDGGTDSDSSSIIHRGVRDPFPTFGTQRGHTGLTPTPSVAPSMLGTDDSDNESIVGRRSPASDSAPISRRKTALYYIIKKFKKKLKIPQGMPLRIRRRALISADTSPKLLPTPGLDVNKALTVKSSSIFFRKDTVEANRKVFDKMFGDVDVNIYNITLLQSRTRRETKQLLDESTIKAVFGDIPLKTPDLPLIAKKTAAVKPKRIGLLKSLTSTPIPTGIDGELNLRGLFNEDSNSLPPISSTPSISAAEESDGVEVRIESGASTSGINISDTVQKLKKRRKNHKLTGWDYIPKKKKPAPKPKILFNNSENSQNFLDEEALVARKKIVTRKQVLWPEQTKEIAAELKTWPVAKHLGENVLHKAARNNNHDVIIYCLESPEFDVNIRDNAGYTPLLEACNSGHLSIAQALLAHGAVVNCNTRGGVRPLHEAAENGHPELVRLLLSYGADPSLSKYSGERPVDLASDRVCKLLLRQYLQDITGLDGMFWDFNGPVKFMDPKGGVDIFSRIPNFNKEIPSITNGEVTDLSLKVIKTEPGLPCSDSATVASLLQTESSTSIKTESSTSIKTEDHKIDPITSDCEFLFEESSAVLPDLFVHKVDQKLYMVLREVLGYLDINKFGDLVLLLHQRCPGSRPLQTRSVSTSHFGKVFRSVMVNSKLEGIPVSEDAEEVIEDAEEDVEEDEDIIHLVHYSDTLSQAMGVCKVKIDK